MTPPVPAPQAHDPAVLEQLVDGNTAFALALYQQLRKAQGNLFFSPYSLSTALAMTYAGARGETARQMAETLHFLLAQEQLHPAFAQLAAVMAAVAAKGAVELNVANALWPHTNYPFLADFLALTKRCYGVTTTSVDYSAEERAQATINDWVAAQTNDKIQALIPAGMLNGLTRLLLVNAIYFKGQWAYPFDPALTRPAPFWRTPDQSVPVPFMTKEQRFLYTENATVQIVGLPYAGDDLVMLIFLPRTTDGLAAFEALMTMETLGPWIQELTPTKVLVTLPRFQLTAAIQLNEHLHAMGMVDAFSDDKADFAGMDGTQMLYMGAALHQAVLTVNEEGAEAAAATAVEMKARALPPPLPLFRADHPFVFLILEQRTGTVLFLGRVVDPR